MVASPTGRRRALRERLPHSPAPPTGTAPGEADDPDDHAIDAAPAGLDESHDHGRHQERVEGAACGEAVQRVADHLVERGYLQRIANPHHDTSPLLRLTPTGDEVLQQLWEDSDGPRARMLVDVETRRLDEAAATLQDLLVALKDQTRR